MKQWLIPSLTLLLVVTLPALAGIAGKADAGKAVYAKKCAVCHGKAGEGKASIAKMLKVELRPLGSEEVQAKSDDELGKVITQGTGKMKPVKGLSATDLTHLIAYVRSLKQT